jgi:hypothetical protein
MDVALEVNTRTWPSFGARRTGRSTLRPYGEKQRHTDARLADDAREGAGGCGVELFLDAAR